MPISTYSTGTVSIGAAATSVVGTGSNWSGQNAMSGDLLVVAGQTVIISDVTDATTLAIDAWPFDAVTAGTTYSIKKVSPLRFVGAQTAEAVDKMVTAINTNGFYVFVGSDETVPDPSLGDDDQYALKATTGQIWQKEGGVWTFVGTFKGFGTPAPWDSTTAYVPQDVVSFEGASYVCIEANTNETPSSGDSPPNAFWTVLAAQGEAATVTVGTVTTGAGGSDAAVSNSGTTGAAVLDFTIPAGEGYGGTSTTSLAIGTGSKAFTTQSGLAYTDGARVRASSAADTTNWMEGLATYSGTSLTVTVTKTNGSGTHADWNLNVVGEPGAGDLTSANNLSDVADAATARSNLGLTAIATAAVGQIPGDTSGSSPPGSGKVGEWTVQTGAVNLAGSGVVTQISSISLTPGTWELEAEMEYGGPGANTTFDFHGCISVNSASFTGALSGPAPYYRLTTQPADVSWPMALVRRRVTITSNTTYYLNAAATYSNSGAQIQQSLFRATRVN